MKINNGRTSSKILSEIIQLAENYCFLREYDELLIKTKETLKSCIDDAVSDYLFKKGYEAGKVDALKERKHK